MFRPNRSNSFSRASFALVITMAMACQESLPTAPLPPTAPPPSSERGSVFGIVGSEAGQCLVGATIEMLDGPRPGERKQQSAADCDSLYDYSVSAFLFQDLPAQSSVMLRASAPGYESKIVTANVDHCCVHHFAASVRINLVRQPTP